MTNYLIHILKQSSSDYTKHMVLITPHTKPAAAETHRTKEIKS